MKQPLSPVILSAAKDLLFAVSEASCSAFAKAPVILSAAKDLLFALSSQ